MQQLKELSPEQIRALSNDQLSIILAHAENTYASDLVTMKAFFTRYRDKGLEPNLDGIADVILALFRWEKQNFYLVISYKQTGSITGYTPDTVLDQCEIDEKYPGIERALTGGIINKLISATNMALTAVYTYKGSGIFKQYANLRVLPIEIINLYEELKKVGLITGI